MLYCIAAVSQNGVIGRDGQLPWSLPDDLAQFKRLTMGSTLIMGRKTFESLPGCLPGRQHWVLTRQQDWQAPGVTVIHAGREFFSQTVFTEPHWVIGGSEIYRLALPYVQRLYLTTVQTEIAGDSFFPSWQPDQWQCIESTTQEADARHAYAMTFAQYQRKECV